MNGILVKTDGTVELVEAANNGELLNKHMDKIVRLIHLFGLGRKYCACINVFGQDMPENKILNKMVPDGYLRGNAIIEKSEEPYTLTDEDVQELALLINDIREDMENAGV